MTAGRPICGSIQVRSGQNEIEIGQILLETGVNTREKGVRHKSVSTVSERGVDTCATPSEISVDTRCVNTV